MPPALSGIEPYGSPVPYGEPPWACGLPSPYIRESHRRLQSAMRKWVEANIIPFVGEWEAGRKLPDNLYKACGAAGILMPMAAGASIPQNWRGRYPIMGGIDGSEWDGFHDFIIHDEMMRTLCVPALRKHGKTSAIESIIHRVISGDSRLSLAITEPEAGSDVQGVTTSAALSPDKTRYIVTGQKKWITGGLYADYFLTLTRTSETGLTLLLIPKDHTVEVRPMEMCGSACAGTAFLEFDETCVPVANRVGLEGKGLAYVMSNFNHERLFISFQSLRCARMCLEDSVAHAVSRETFGQKLAAHAVVRNRLAHMARETESLQAWIESLVYQLDHMSEEASTALLAGQTAQLKAHSGIVLERVASQAIQLMGGLGLTRGGRGERVERIWRDVKAITIPGGSEDILLDLSIRRALRGLMDQPKSRPLTGKI
ncbi:hypothetical protein BDW75DRAFT_247127 [Aspergillus navahoensis]